MYDEKEVIEVLERFGFEQDSIDGWEYNFQIEDSRYADELINVLRYDANTGVLLIGSSPNSYDCFKWKIHNSETLKSMLLYLLGLITVDVEPP